MTESGPTARPPSHDSSYYDSLTVTTNRRIVVTTNRKDAMRDPADNKTRDLIEKPKTKAQRFRERQLATGLRQYSFWMTEAEALIIRDYIERLREAK